MVLVVLCMFGVFLKLQIINGYKFMYLTVGVVFSILKQPDLRFEWLKETKMLY